MSLNAMIASKALELIQLLEHHDDGDFVDAIVNAVASCDYAALMQLEGSAEE